MRCPETYLAGMKKSMNTKEKLWFIKQVNLSSYDMIVDFGCATGSILAIIDKLLPEDSNTLLCGIDKMTYLEDEYPRLNHSVVFLSALNDIKTEALQDKKILLILSSVLHEVDNSTLTQLINWACDYVTTVVCRDMFFPMSYQSTPKYKEIKAYHSLTSDEQRQLEEIRSTYVTKCERYWLTKLLYEFFLKYTYKENWDTEVQEIYLCNKAFDFCTTLGGINKTFNPYPFFISYFKTYILPYKKKEVQKKFGYKMRYPTHIKFILNKEI